MVDSAFKYCSQRDVKDVYPNIDESDSKTVIRNWESLGNNIYIAHNVGLVTVLFMDGKLLNPIEQGAVSAAHHYKTALTSNLEGNPDHDNLNYNLINYNASFSTGNESDIQLGDFIELDNIIVV